MCDQINVVSNLRLIGLIKFITKDDGSLHGTIDLLQTDESERSCGIKRAGWILNEKLHKIRKIFYQNSEINK